MDLIVRYYLHQARRGHADNGIGLIYSNPSFHQRGHGIGIILGMALSLILRPLFWHAAKTLGSEALATGQNIQPDMSEPKAKFRYVVLEACATRRMEF